MVSRKVVSLVDLSLVREVPWGPHEGLKLTVKKNVREVMVRRMVRPLPYDHPSLQTIAGEPWDMTWADAKQAAERELKEFQIANSQTLKEQAALMKDIGALEESINLGNQLTHWSRAVEHQALASRGVDNRGAHANRAKGRAMPVKFVETPIARRRCDPGAQRLPGGYNDRARLWATVNVLLSRLLRAKAQSDAARVRASRINVVRCAAGRDEVSWRTWVAVTNHADVGAARMAIFRACAEDSTEEDVNASMELFSRLEADEVSKARADSTARWHAWVSRALKGGSKDAHAWSNAPNTVPAEVFAPGLSSPLEVVGYHTRKWAEAWGADDADRVSTAIKVVTDLREQALRKEGHGSCCSHIQAEFLRKLAETFSHSTAIGPDAQAFTDIATASTEARAELAAIMVRTVRAVTWPLQSLLVVMGLLGKKSGGTRTIAIMATFARLLLGAIKNDVRKWDEEVADDRDTALRGRRPADETARRHLGVEAATILGRFAIMVLWDMRAFFDSLETDKLAAAATAAGFPLDHLALGLAMHRAPRVLRVHGCYGDVVPRTGRSVLAGCTLSTSFARAYLEPLSRACASDERGTLWKHVDDLTQVIVAPTKQLAAARAIQKGQLLAAEATRLNLRIADKSRVVANLPSIAMDVARGIRGDGVPILAADRADDLGVTTTGGRRRGTSSLSARLAKGLKRARRVKRLVAANRGAQKLYRTGVDPQQGYEGAIIGVAPPQLRAMRRNAALSVSAAGLRPCLASLLAWRLDEDCDPAVREPLKQVQLWRRLWDTTPEAERSDLRKAWRRALPKVLLKGVHWGAVSGPMQATIATLGQVGWAPVQPDRWLTEDRTRYADLSDPAPEAGAQIELQVKLAAKRLLWRGAASHHLGRGLEEGIPSFEAARVARKWLVRHHRPAEVKALDQVVCGGVWCGGREHVRRMCRCGQPETAWHRYWGCSRLDEIVGNHGDSIVRDTQWLAKEFDGAMGQYHCLWGRAILPSSLIDVGPEITADVAASSMVVSPLFQDLLKAGVAVYSDGSGGPGHAPRAFPISGSGLAALKWAGAEDDMTLTELAVAAGPVPGRQTVPRAELWSAISVGERAPGDAPVQLGADASYVVDTAADVSRLARAMRSANGDLWSRFDACRKSRTAALDIRKVEAHAPPSEVLSGQRSFQEYIGNHIADAAAGAAAEVALDRSDRARVIEIWERRAYLIARRLASIEAWHWEHVPGQRYLPPEPLQPWTPPDQQEVRSDIVGKVGNRGHVLRKVEGKIMCLRCHRRRDTRNVQYWMKVVCRPIANIPPQPLRGSGSGLPRRERDGGDAAAGQQAMTTMVTGLTAATTTHAVVSSFPDGTYGDDANYREDKFGDMQAFDDPTDQDDLGVPQAKRLRSAQVAHDVGGDHPISLMQRGRQRDPEDGQGDSVPGVAEKRRRRVSELPGHLPVVGPSAVAASSSSQGADQLSDVPQHIMDDHPDEDISDVQALDVLMAHGDAMQDDHSPHEDPFGYAELGFDQGESIGTPGDEARGEVQRADGPTPPVDAPAVPTELPGHREDAQPIDQPHDHVEQQGDGLVTARERRRLVLEQQAERRKRRRLEMQAVTMAWGQGDAIIDAAEFVDLPTVSEAPPFPIHETHQLVMCGGYSGCIRCGRVVAYQGHDRFGAPCRGYCPSGSSRPMRRLAKGEHPHPAARGHLADEWPSGETAPVPRRFRPLTE